MEISSNSQKGFKIKAKSATAILNGDKIVITKNEGEDFVVDGEGEYEVGGISIIKLAYAYVVEVDGARVVSVTTVKDKLTEAQLEELGPIDIALIPTDGDSKLAAEVAKQLDPWVMIPDNFNPTAFLKEMGVAELNAVPKFSATGDKLPSELQIVVLENKGKDK